MRTIALRTDRGVLAKPSLTNSGSMTIEGHAARAHLSITDGLDYGDHIERRSLDEVRAIVKQLIGAPLTWEHPTSFFRENPNAATKIGVVTDAWLDGEHAAFRATITDDAAKRMIRSGAQVEISLGYETLVVDGWQTRISVDHVAVVERGRCGNTCRIATDHYKEGTHAMDPELLAAAAAVNVKIDNLDEQGVAHAVMRASGVDPKGPRAGDRSETIDAMPLAYQVARAVSAATYAQRDAADAARRDSFATAKRHDAPGCGCGGNKPSAVNSDAFNAGSKNAYISPLEIEARQRMVKAGRLAHVAHADDERRAEVEAIDAYDHRAAIARVSPPFIRGDRDDSPEARQDRERIAKEARSRNAMVAASAAAHKIKTVDSEER